MRFLFHGLNITPSTQVQASCPDLPPDICAGLGILGLPAPGLGSMWRRQSRKSLSHGSGERVLVPVLSVTLGSSHHRSASVSPTVPGRVGLNHLLVPSYFAGPTIDDSVLRSSWENCIRSGMTVSLQEVRKENRRWPAYELRTPGPESETHSVILVSAGLAARGVGSQCEQSRMKPGAKHRCPPLRCRF